MALVVPAAGAEAACRPITIADLPPLPTDEPPPAPESPEESEEAVPPQREAAPEPPPPPPRAPRSCFVYRMQWPVLGGETGSSFGSPREGGARRHLGVDIFAPKLTPVVAVAAGTITELHAEGRECCWVKIRHDDGWYSVYVHLNNDTFGTDDGKGAGVRPGLQAGDRVMAGQVIGWLGDSGNAETASPHLHFELRTRSGVPIDPLPSLRWAQRNAPVPALEGASRAFDIAFVDDDGQPAEVIINLLTSRGAFTPCDEWGTRACPAAPASLLEASTWVEALTGIEVPVLLPKVDLSSSSDDDLVAAALTCQIEECPPPLISVGEAARIITWTLQWLAYSAAGETAAAETVSTATPLDPPAAGYGHLDPQLAWGGLLAQGLASSCPEAPLAAEALLTRAALAELIGQAFGQLPVVTCAGVS